MTTLADHATAAPIGLSADERHAILAALEAQRMCLLAIRRHQAERAPDVGCDNLFAVSEEAYDEAMKRMGME